MADPLDLIEKKSIIKKQQCFTPLTDEETGILADLLSEVHFKPGDTIVTEGDPVDSIYLIVSGTAEVRHVYVEDKVVKFTPLATLGEGAAIGLNETGLYSLSGVRTATVVAITDMVALCLSVAAFHGFALAYTHVSEVMRKHADSILNENTESTDQSQTTK